METHAFEAKHLSASDQIKQGSFYTPKKIVDKVHELIDFYKKHKKHLVIFDNSAGAGAFIKKEKNMIYKVAEIDPIALNLLRKKLPASCVFSGNALSQVERKKYNISSTEFLIQVGNPPYNDTTSAYKKGEKGKNLCDKDLFDRDLGISFLKSYSKLKADIICVLHPLSYLIKESNLRRLKILTQNYRLEKGILFSSSLFKKQSSTPFPIVIALYKKSSKGTSYQDIQKFKFCMLNGESQFILNKYKTTDSFIRKYPPTKTDKPISDINLYYYTFRDINSLMRNKGFDTQKRENSIVVSINELYKYAYLFSFKQLFDPIDKWVYGNLSPLGELSLVEKNKKLFVKYFFITAKKTLSNLDHSIKSKILNYYSLKKTDLKNTSSIKEQAHLLINSCLDKKEVCFHQKNFDFV